MIKTVLITGTSSGYGKATAELFLRRGWNVLATMRRPESASFEVSSGRLKVLPLDVTDQSSIDAAIAEGVATFGAIDALVNNAGIGMASVVEATPDATIREVFETNTFGVFATCRAIIPQMRKQGGGHVVNLTSSTTIGVMPLVAIYAASKCAVEGFTESLSYELEGFGIKARLVEPGYAPTTSFTANGTPRMQGLIPPDYSSFAQSCFGKMASYPTPYCTEEEVAEAVFAAATDDGRKIRYPAGADTKLLAELRWSTSEDHYLQKMREMFGPELAA
ncbi:MULTISPECIES: SDR family oxidoreductase [unclassified Bosea (in: a-proteobacteria)]|uniref:SDR family oxidoreductase n=1 Tax=unclassified Bosea (in: a-proteobacteria) TaxID=2653178 RepID=UPI000F75E4EA|nr:MULTISPECIES: SDR family oxidoreductase [unclassified Bosea (in: a-proteobacteria)]AZO78146.1 short-chain dehydrogenase/reductase [Bosea sp. Tri-49]RXT20373.1 short-chain dehydrogenase/reductase [Bosea sp. Tri-39]RXT37245.1 short-chain dehydrogenase/reductase [Bosea sp. Tri-54]